MSLRIFEIDRTLEACQGQIWDRVNGYRYWLGELDKNEAGLENFAEGYKIFGFIREKGGYTYREWLPNAKQAFLIGAFNDWQNSTPLKSEGFGRWAVFLPDKVDGSPGIPHATQIKVRVEANDGSWHDRVPAWIKLAWQELRSSCGVIYRGLSNYYILFWRFLIIVIVMGPKTPF
ncbi:SBE2.1 [Symbiodinium sp. CCMP2456]|nr:SBE2.1 [Symbiodinium sp. CCMP2456]